MAQNVGRIRVSRYKAGGEQIRSHDAQSLKMATGAVSRYKLPPKLGISQVAQSLIASTGAESGWCFIRVMLLESRKFKNRDKQMNFIVRVRHRRFMLSVIILLFKLMGNFMTVAIPNKSPFANWIIN